MIRWFRDRGASGERGTTLVELMVTMAIFTVVIVAITQLSINFQRASAMTANRQEQVDIGRTSVETMTSVLRTSVMPSQLSNSCSITVCTQDAFVAAQPYSVQFYANYRNPGNTIGPSRVTYTVSPAEAGGATITQKIQRPDSPAPGASGYLYCAAEAIGASAPCKARLTTVVLAHDIVTTTGTPTFTYYDNYGVQLVVGTSGSLTTDQLKRIAAIELTVTSHVTQGVQAQPTTYIQRVTLPNAQAVIRNTEGAS